MTASSLSNVSATHSDDTRVQGDTSELPHEAEKQPIPDEEAPPAAAPKPAGPNPADFPDGGWDAWSCVLGSWCCMFASMGWINCIGVFQNYYQHNQLSNYSPSTVAWISSTETFMMFVGAPFFGKIFDNYGPRYMLLVGSFCHVFGLMMTSLASKYYQIFLAQAVVSALGISAVFYACLNPIGTWFFKRRALAFGIISAGASLGGVVLPIMVSQVANRSGFGWAMRSVAFLFLGLLIIGNLTVKSRLQPKATPFVVGDFLNPFKETPFLMVSLGSFFFFWGVFLPTNFIILEAQSYGMSERLSNYLLAILNALSVVGRILPNWLGDHVGRFNVMIVTTYLTAILVLALWIPANTNALNIVFAALFGFTSGTFVSMVPAIVAQVTKDVRTIGVRNGANFFIISLAALTGNPIAGALVSRDQNSFLYLQIFCGITMFVGATFFLLARIVQVGWAWKRV
jgi:MFS family permease